MLEHEERTGELGILSLCLFLVPSLGWLTGTYVALGAEGDTVKLLSYFAFAVGASLLVLILGSSLIAGTNRARMSLVFGPLARLVMLLLASSVLVQAGLFVYSMFTLEAVLIGRVHVGILLAIGLGALFASVILVRSAFSFFTSVPSSIRGTLLGKDDAPALFSRIGSMADRLGAAKPDHIIVGLEPNFFVTAAPVQLVGQDLVLEGRTLFISLGLMRLLSKAEFDAVIGHELGHFRGEDTVYSMKFAPTYARLTQALHHLSDSTGNGASDLAQMPATLALSFYLTRFATSERTVGRQRELLADQAGADVAGPKSLATALLKVALFAPVWDQLTGWHIDELGEGRTFTRLSETYQGACRLNEELEWENVLERLGAAIQSHPIDTHPQLYERLESLKISLWDMRPEDCLAARDAAIELVPDAPAIDEGLSHLEARWLLAIGAAELPSEPHGIEQA